MPNKVKISKRDDKFRGNNAASSIKKARFWFFTVMSMIWIRNRNFAKVGTGTAINRYHKVPHHCLKTWSKPRIFTVPLHSKTPYHYPTKLGTVPLVPVKKSYWREERRKRTCFFEPCFQSTSFWILMRIRYSGYGSICPKNDIWHCFLSV